MSFSLRPSLFARSVWSRWKLRELSQQHTSGPIQKTLEEKLQQLKPSVLKVFNESHMHLRVPEGSESHFKVVIVSDVFKNKKLPECHKLVTDILQDELQAKWGIHALSIQTHTPEQWKKSEGKIQDSPPCAKSLVS